MELILDSSNIEQIKDLNELLHVRSNNKSNNHYKKWKKL